MMGGRRLAAVAAAVLLTLTGTVVAATPALAAPKGCSYTAGHYQQAGGYIVGYRFYACISGDDILLPVEVERYQSPGVYLTVASGQGEATYHCTGMDYFVYRTTATEPFPILCT